MRRMVLTLATAVVAWSAAACGGGEVVVVAHIEQTMAATGELETMALSSLPVRLLPFDRDLVFDSLSEAFPEPEPEVPDSIFDLQQRVVDQQAEWRAANARWEVMRDSLQNISNQMAGMDQSSGEYFALFQEFNDLEGEVDRLQEAADAAFEQFTQLQQRLNTQSREITIARQNWADEAFASIDSVFMHKYDERGAVERWDTTGTQGVARFTRVKAGEWWVNARYDRQFDELYWNVPIVVESGDEVRIELTEANAEVRQKM